jgi:hypothetical protein
LLRSLLHIVSPTHGRHPWTPSSSCRSPLSTASMIRTGYVVVWFPFLICASVWTCFLSLPSSTLATQPEPFRPRRGGRSAHVPSFRGHRTSRGSSGSVIGMRSQAASSP